jgi:putative flippase GtrA
VNSLLRFSVVGSLGFVVDLLVLMVATQVFKVDALLARLISMPVAAVVTYLLNRVYTFDAKPAGLVRLLVYIGCVAVGLLVNTAVYALVLLVLGEHPLVLCFAAGCGAIAGLSFNYGLARHVVFKPEPRAGAKVVV